MLVLAPIAPIAISVVGHDDDLFTCECVPALTTVAIDKAEPGRIGAEILRRRLAQPDAPVNKSRLPVHLIERDSVAAVGRQRHPRGRD